MLAQLNVFIRPYGDTARFKIASQPPRNGDIVSRIRQKYCCQSFSWTLSAYFSGKTSKLGQREGSSEQMHATVLGHGPPERKLHVGLGLLWLPDGGAGTAPELFAALVGPLDY